MEPLSTALLSLALFAPVLPTRKPDWSITSIIKSDLASSDWEHLRSISNGSFTSSFNGNVVHVTSKPSTELLISPEAAYQYPLDRKNMLKKQILSYSTLSDGWDGVGSLKPTQDAINTAEKFIELLPSGIPLPTPMLASDGEIGFYWDTESAYADLHLEEGGLISLYTRERFGELAEGYVEVSFAEINQVWLLDNLDVLNERELLLAA
ncbi:MAG: hypothetical protein CTY10_01195 [Methylotenera sp.]|nr:MAG: hypothetical protein CTY10_01195 [Methylotenera sp.]